MIRCAYCGAKNKDAYEYCVRCSEPLDLAVAIQPSPFRFLVYLLVLAVVAAAAMAIWQRTGPAEEASPGGQSGSRAAGTSTTPQHSLQGVVIISPNPWQWEQVREIAKNPC